MPILVIQTAPPIKQPGTARAILHRFPGNLYFDWLRNGTWENQQKPKERRVTVSRILLFSHSSQSYNFRYFYFVFLYLLIIFSRA